MKSELQYFKNEDFHSALRTFFKKLNIPVNYIAEESARPQDILSEKTYKKDHPAFQLMNDVYFLGMVDDAAFEKSTSLDPEKIESDYDGILIFGVTLNQRENGLLPTRSQLAEITRSFNREYCYTPVVVVFKYKNNDNSYISFANAERLQFKQEWREGEKAGKVSLLRDIDLDNPHSGHLRILSELAIPRSGKKAVNSFADLYAYWQTVFNVSLLNKKFYEELSNWYFWAIKEVTFPSQPTLNDVIKETGKKDHQRLEDLIHEHNAKNVIRLLTRFLFVWFIKEKNLVPEELFDLEYLKNEILKNFSPYHIESKGTLFEILHADTGSNYYKAILQNLFFASLNCPIVPLDKGDTRKRRFKKNEYYGQDRDANFLLRYEDQFRQPEKFLELINKNVPFLNGGLFECLDNKTEKIYIDGFSDNLIKPHELIVPDYLFFGFDEEVDLSGIIGIKNKKTERAVVKGLIKIFESYKFTIAENTPIEEDVALDPELLGKVFENLLASYNPETKTTARKQTGSFYTPREIVNYMVDESLIAYLKNAVKDWKMPEEEQDSKLRQLLSFDPVNPFENDQSLQKWIIKTLGHCTILDPACGSGAFPMGALQKMVHILQKVDPDNEHWKGFQLNRAIEESEHAFQEIKDKHARQRQLDEINETFDVQINDPDYARKLFLIENCIYGVDIQPVAAQITKLRFFISLVVDQKVDKEKNSENFGIRPLPNLETKFVAANTLIGIEKPDKQGNFFANPEIDELEESLKIVRHRIFSAKTPRTKRKLRDEDLHLRKQMDELLVADGWQSKSAGQLAGWNPYDQNTSSPFFDPEWMFGIKGGFDIVIGNPPYGAKFNTLEKETFKKNYKHQNYQPESYLLFIERSFNLILENGVLAFIIPNTWLTNLKLTNIRKLITQKSSILDISHYHESVFDAVVDTEVLILRNRYDSKSLVKICNHISAENIDVNYYPQEKWFQKNGRPINIFITSNEEDIMNEIANNSQNLGEICKVVVGMKPYQVGKGKPKQDVKTVKNRVFDSNENVDGSYSPLLRGRDINKFENNWQGNRWIKYGEWLAEPRISAKFDAKKKIVLRQTGDSLIATIDNKQFICMNNLHVIRADNTNINLGYILAILNSTLMNFYYQGLNPEIGEALAEVKKENVSSLKIRKTNDGKAIEFLTELLLFINGSKHKSSFFNVLDGLIFELYFTDHMKEKQIDIMQFVKKDLAKVIQDRDFEQLPDSEKEIVINQLHTKWTHPDSEVRNRIKLFAVRSPEILKPILESR